MWKKVGVVTESNKNSPVLDTKRSHQYTPSSIDKISMQSSQAQHTSSVKNHSFCNRYFKSIEKKRLNGSRLSSSSKEKLQNSQLVENYKTARDLKSLRTQGNDSMIVIGEKNQKLFSSNHKKGNESPIHLKQLMHQAQYGGYKYNVKSISKLKQLKKRVRVVKSDYKQVKQSIVKQILLFKSQLNKMQSNTSSLEFSSGKQQIQSIPTDSSIPSGSPSKDTLKAINQQINRYQKSLADLEKRKQQFIALIQQNQKKIKS